MRKQSSVFIGLCLATLSATPVWAGAGYIIAESGVPSTWDNSVAIPLHPESGSCASFNNADMLTKLDNNLSTWTDLSEVDLDFSLVTGSLGSVDGDNYGTFLSSVTGGTNAAASDGLNPMLFDDDGEIIASVAGSGNRFRVLGFANPAGFSEDVTEILEGQAVFNCRCLPGNPNGACTVASTTIDFSEDELDFTMIHELGHFLNLDHTQVNADLIDDDNASNDDNIPTMYPVSENAAEQLSPIQDDISALGRLYPSATFLSTHCKITGSLVDVNGDSLRCADVQAIPSDRSKSVAFVSGSYAPALDNNGDGDTADEGECQSNCGDFELYIDPGVQFDLRVEPINSAFVGGSGISPCANAQIDVESEALGSIVAGSCTPGETLALGTIETSSTAPFEDGGNSGTGSSGSCTLNTNSSSASPLWLLLATGLSVLGVRRFAAR